MPKIQKTYQIMLGTFMDNKFIWHEIEGYDDMNAAYKAFKAYVNSQLKYTDEELKKVWDTGRLDIELRQGTKLLNWVGIYARAALKDVGEDSKASKGANKPTKVEKEEDNKKEDKKKTTKHDSVPSNWEEVDLYKQVKTRDAEEDDDDGDELYDASFDEVASRAAVLGALLRDSLLAEDAQLKELCEIVIRDIDTLSNIVANGNKVVKFRHNRPDDERGLFQEDDGVLCLDFLDFAYQVFDVIFYSKQLELRISKEEKKQYRQVYDKLYNERLNAIYGRAKNYYEERGDL